MNDTPRDVLITGIGLVSSLGEGIATHIDLLSRDGAPRPSIEEARFAPYFVHVLPAIDWSAQIPKKGDQRQMETWQKLGTYAAGLALADAAIPADEATRSGVDMIVAAGGGERDLVVDSLVMERARASGGSQAVTNETLAGELRPTLFLAQLSNLLAGNISIVHKVTGSSRTFMGEEGAGVSAVATAAARIAGGQSEICLVGGAYSAERKDLLLNYEMAGLLLRDEWRGVFAREEGRDGLSVGSVGAFLVLESATHAAERSAAAYARLVSVAADRGRRDPAALSARLRELLAGRAASGGDLLIMSGASGLAGLTRAEQDILRELYPQAALRGYGSLLGHSFEAQFPAGIALAAASLARRVRLPAFDPGNEAPASAAPGTALVTTVGHAQAEGVGVLAAVGPH